MLRGSSCLGKPTVYGGEWAALYRGFSDLQFCDLEFCDFFGIFSVIFSYFCFVTRRNFYGNVYGSF